MPAHRLATSVGEIGRVRQVVSLDGSSGGRGSPLAPSGTLTSEVELRAGFLPGLPLGIKGTVVTEASFAAIASSSVQPLEKYDAPSAEAVVAEAAADAAVVAEDAVAAAVVAAEAAADAAAAAAAAARRPGPPRGRASSRTGASRCCRCCRA